MFIELAKNNGTDYLRVVEGYTYTNNEGVKKHKRRVVKNIGPLARFDDGKPDYLKRLRQSFKDGEPLIAELLDCIESVPTKKSLAIEFDLENESDCFCAPRNLGYFFLDAFYDMLGIYDVLNLHKSRSNLKYDVNGNAKLLIFGRVLFPDSKFGTFEDKDRYLFSVTKSDKVKDVYYVLDSLNDKADTIQTRMNLRITENIGRNTEVCYYDVTNYYFEIGENDPDMIDENGEVIRKGLRKKGVSKEKRTGPVVQMGLFIDMNGIPISYRLFPGSNTDTTTLRPAMEKTIDKMNFDKVIIVADGGINSGPNIARILDSQNGYIVSKSTKNSDKAVKEWILDEAEYAWNDEKTFKVKSKIRKRTIKREDGSVMEITEKLVCFWSRKHYLRERRENEDFIAYLDSVAAFPYKLKDRPKKIEKFLKKTEIDKATGKAVKTKTSISLDMEKIREYLELMGYYTIMTSEIDRTDSEIIGKYHGLSRIEDSFRITKSDLKSRPVFVRTPEHINAHFLTCFIALVIIRLIQHKILMFQGRDTKDTNGWESGLSAERIQKALREWQADPLPGGYYRLTRPGEDLCLIMESLGLSTSLRIPVEPELRSLKYAIDKLIM